MFDSKYSTAKSLFKITQFVLYLLVLVADFANFGGS